MFISASEERWTHMGFRVVRHRRTQGERKELMKADNKGNKIIYSQF